MIYLASPYSHPEPHIRTRRYILARDFTYHHISLGAPIFSPIVYGHQFARDLEAPTDAVSWAPFNRVMLDAAEEMWILTLPGWEESAGVQAEILHMEQAKTPYKFVEPLPNAYF